MKDKRKNKDAIVFNIMPWHTEFMRERMKRITKRLRAEKSAHRMKH